MQAKAALLPSLNWQNGLVYTQPNGTDTGVFIAANAPHEYINQAAVHADIFAPGKRADYRAALAGDMKADAELAASEKGIGGGLDEAEGNRIADGASARRDGERGAQD